MGNYMEILQTKSRWITIQNHIWICMLMNCPSLRYNNSRNQLKDITHTINRHKRIKLTIALLTFIPELKIGDCL